MGKWENGTSINKNDEPIDCFALETPLKKRDGKRHPSSSSEDTSVLIGSHSNSGTYNDMSKRSFSKAVNNETSEALINKHAVAGVHLGMQDEKILSLSTPDLPIPLQYTTSSSATPKEFINSPQDEKQVPAISGEALPCPDHSREPKQESCPRMPQLKNPHLLPSDSKNTLA